MSTDEWPIGYQPLDWSDDDGDYVQYGDYTIEAAYDDNDAVVGYYVSWSEDGMREDLGSEDIGGIPAERSRAAAVAAVEASRRERYREVGELFFGAVGEWTDDDDRPLVRVDQQRRIFCRDGDKEFELMLSLDEYDSFDTATRRKTLGLRTLNNLAHNGYPDDLLWWPT
ncbi:hypothetical protein [Mycolicibacterium aichiense]|uniref:Uncharacterized protein n=1 Tax=Mycolicibacterium aichiense TaxID=1799 RepID=A0AAD1HQP2_9MYCO|nr:hypothetical protein [Mycolicibacterium aichiense]MCV7016290.1 hypothetical protein [Mycolicibacterium aichiense]BBX09942.1 hypothetical protein MAIC_47450 [Mycolicibacterium aichiense]STZ26393.1 Uncharacterised protein [Mycolicibacterium aichiense]